MDDNLRILKAMVRGTYDLQMLRMQCGLRLCANFRAKLKQKLGEEEEKLSEDGELSEEAKSLISLLKESYKRLTDGIAKNRTLPSESGFIGDELISTYSELTLVHQYIGIEKNEVSSFGQLEATLRTIPIYNEYLADVKGIGPAMAAVLITGFDIFKAQYPSSFWMYAGLDVVPIDGRGRTRQAAHLVERTYINKVGVEATRMGVTYNPWLKTKLMGVLAGSFMRASSPWAQVYYGYKHRLETDPSRKKVTLAEYKKMHKNGEDTSKVWPPGRINRASQRYMVKQFLLDFWREWRKIEGLPIPPSYSEGKLGMPPHSAAAE